MRSARELLTDFYTSEETAPTRPDAPQPLRTALLLVSELVTNGIQHGSAPVTLRINDDSQRLRVSVTDNGAGTPVLRPTVDLHAESGRGLQLVHTLATTWGVPPEPDIGKTVWFELPTPRIPAQVTRPTPCL